MGTPPSSSRSRAARCSGRSTSPPQAVIGRCVNTPACYRPLCCRPPRSLLHTCPDCGKTMATLGGLEIHAEMYHAAPVPEPAPEAVAPPPPVAPIPAPAPSRQSAPVLRGYDPTIPLTALLVVVMLIAGLGAAVHRSGNPPHH